MPAAQNLVVAQSGGPSPVINNTLRGIVEAARDLDAIGTVYAARHGIEGVLKEELQCDGRSTFLAAVHVLKASGLYGLVKPEGPIDATDLDTADRERRRERRWAAMVADLDPLSR